MGIFSGSGVGKSVLLGMMARYTAADVIVIGLIGERGRELNQFIERDLGPAELDESFDREPFLDLLARFLDATELRTDWDSLKEADDELLVNSLAMLLPFGTEDKQALLEAPSLTTRRETLVALMEFALAAQGQAGHEDKMQ